MIRLGYKAPTTGDYVICCTQEWRDDGDELYSFDGKTVGVLESEGVTKVVALFITPTTDWEAKHDNNRWVDGVSLGMDIEGKCPIPNVDFAYYIAYVAVTSDYADYEVATDGDAPAAPEPTLDRAVDVATLQGSVEDAIDEANDPTAVWTPGSWVDNGDGTHTLEVGYASGGDTGTATYTITWNEEDPTAELVGTSCPECGVINP